MSYNIFRKNGQIKVKFPSGSTVSFENDEFGLVTEDPDDSNNIIIVTQTTLLDDPRPYTDFRGEGGVSLGSTRSEVISALQDVLTSDSDIGQFVKVDVSGDLSQTTQLVHDGSVDNGGAVILDSNSAQLGFRTGTFLKLTEGVGPGGGTRKYGRMELKVDNGSGQPADAINIVQGDITQSPNITISGETDFVRNVTFGDDVILTAPDGTEYYLRVTNGGTLHTQAV